jgi:myo-inositol-1(or 4)-monophosphatase
MNSPDFVSFASDVARDAGAVLMSHYEKVTVEYKGLFDTVTVADRAAEKLIVARIRAQFPSHSIVAEEGGGIDQGDDYVWYIDPLDGTTNFAHGLPRFCVSIGLWAKGRRRMGVVFDPTRNELYCAESGSGAYLNTRRLKVSEVADFRQALFATGFPSSIRHSNVNVHYYYQVAMNSHGVRRTGSAALDLCSVARGHLEGFWEIGLKSWDVGAGLVILAEAGGHYCDFEGGGYQPGDAHLVSTNGKVTDAVLKLFADVGRGEFLSPMPQLRSE